MKRPLSDAEQIERVLQMFRGKYTIRILCEMRSGPVRLGQLKRSVPEASKKALTAGLRALEDARLVVRRYLSDSKLHVQYELLEHGILPVIGLLDLLANWSVLEPEKKISEDS